MDDATFASDVDVATQEILLASSRHDIPKLRALLRDSDANVRDTETGSTPMHATIAACEPDKGEAIEVNGERGGSDHGDTNGGVEGEDPGHASTAALSAQEKLLAEAAETVRFLFQHGATWNEVDSDGETPGCMALRLGLKEIYEIIVDQGVRSELLSTRMDQYEVLLDEGEGQNGTEEVAPDTQSAADEMNDAVADAVRRFTPHFDVFAADTDLMRTIASRTAELILPRPELRLLSVEPARDLLVALQSRQPAVNHVFASHADTIEGQAASPTVHYHEGSWETQIDQSRNSGEISTSSFDAVVFGSVSTSYQQFRIFVSQWAEQLLYLNGGADGDGGLMSFFHSFGAHRQVEYDVYTKLIEIDLFEAGFDTEWIEISMPGTTGGEEQRPWMPKAYRLPVCRLVD